MSGSCTIVTERNAALVLLSAGLIFRVHQLGGMTDGELFADERYIGRLYVETLMHPPTLLPGLSQLTFSSLVAIWTAIAGPSALALRGFSAALGILGLWVWYAFVKRRAESLLRYEPRPRRTPPSAGRDTRSSRNSLKTRRFRVAQS